MQKMRDTSVEQAGKKEKETGEWIKKVDTELAVTVD